jgi:TFIIF-interacting CTD phosphatase-like protein
MYPKLITPRLPLKNITLIINYMKNIEIYKIETIREKIYKNILKIEEIPPVVTTESNTGSMLPPAVPYLPETHRKPFTLVLDLDETLVHYVEDEESAYIQIRPGAETFLEEMSEHYELVVFTAAMQDVK